MWTAGVRSGKLAVYFTSNYKHHMLKEFYLSLITMLLSINVQCGSIWFAFLL